MILYFSGTGNSKFIANKINLVLQDDIQNLNLIIKRNLPKEFNSNKPFVFVLPTYAWRIPRVMENLLLKATFSGSNKCYFVLTCGSSAGNSEKYIRKILKKTNLDLHGFFQIKMPENYIARYNVPSDEKIEHLIKEGEEKAKEIGVHIKEEDYIINKNCGPIDRILSALVNPLFYKFCVKSDDFYVKKDCIGCHKCQNACPVNNIYMKDDKPLWKHKCIHCMACISICPLHAIEYEGRTENKKRYYLE